MNRILNEDDRRTLISKGRKGQNYITDRSKGKNRFERRVKSKISSSVKEYNNIDMNKLFKDDVLEVGIKVKGETDTYMVQIAFGGFCEILRDNIKKTNDEVTLRAIIKSLITGFNKTDVLFRCSCPDFQYRFSFWASREDMIVGDAENRPAKITNPNNTLGPACKHILLILNNTSFLMKIGSVISNYVHYMEKHYQKLYANVIYPAIYGKEYEEPYQLNLDDQETDELTTDSSEIDTANEYGRKRTQFKKGNTQGIRFAKSDKDPNQLTIVDDEEEIED